MKNPGGEEYLARREDAKGANGAEIDTLLDAIGVEHVHGVVTVGDDGP